MIGSERILRGVAASGGIAIGRAVIALDPEFVAFNYRIEDVAIPAEVARFRESVRRSREQLQRIQEELRHHGSNESFVLIDAHLLILEDRMFVDRVVERIELSRMNAESAILQVTESLFEAYDRLHDDYIRERRGDLEDIVRRLMHNLDTHTPTAQEHPEDAVLIGRAIPPSTLLELRERRIVGLVTESGSPLSHTAIMARSLRIPALVGVEGALGIGSGETVIVDSIDGQIVVSPGADTLIRYRERIEGQREKLRKAVTLAGVPCVSRDGVRISLGANINFKEEAPSVAAADCDFVGLYRTEFDFFTEGKAPAEDALVEDYVAVLQGAGGRPVTFRTLDVGMEGNRWDGLNPGMGTRGIRYCLENPEIFRLQLRGLLRASAHGPARLLLPFVSTVEELDEALVLLADVRSELHAKSVPFDAAMPVGVMIETPAAAQTCDLMAPRVDFFSLGTNDLIQYYLVIDRTDRARTHLYNPFHPAVLRCLHQIATLLGPFHKPVTVCGEMAADPLSAAVLLALGFESLSVSLGAYARVKGMIRNTEVGELRALMPALLKDRNARAVEDRVRALFIEGMQA